MAPGDEDVHHIIQNESVEESREKGADLSTSKLQLKKKKLESTRRRTKTGCLSKSFLLLLMAQSPHFELDLLRSAREYLHCVLVMKDSLSFYASQEGAK